MSLTRDGLVGIGTTSPEEKLTITDGVIRLNSTTATSKFLIFYDTAGVRHVIGSDATAGTNELGIRSEGQIIFGAGSGRGEAARIDASKRLLVGTSTSRSQFNGVYSGLFQVDTADNLQRVASFTYSGNDTGGAIITLNHQRSGTVGGNSLVANNDELGTLLFQGGDGSKLLQGARVDAYVDGTPGANDMPTRLVFSTTADGAASPTERMRITQAGHVLIGTTDADANISGTPTNPPIASFKVGNGEGFRVSSTGAHFWNFANDGAVHVFRRNGTNVGSISVSSGATAYNTSSDYRLKENITAVTDGITRLQQLKPSRFNFIADSVKTVDGFIAHEVQAVVPEAIHGIKDEVDADGNPVMQGIDQSKLVPLLTAALQEAIAKIETLEARLTAAGIE
jgi:hypothetical protein